MGPDFDLDGKVDNHNAIKLIYGEVETNTISNSIHIVYFNKRDYTLEEH